MNYLKYFNILFLTTLSLYSFILEVHSIDCPHATAWPITPINIKMMYDQNLYYIHKYYTASNFTQNIFFPAEYTKMSHINFKIYEPFILTASVFTAYPYITQSDQLQCDYQFRMDDNLPIFEFDGPNYKTRLVYTFWFRVFPTFKIRQESQTLKFALVYLDEERSFSIYQSCDGKYAWVQIPRDSILAHFHDGRNPFEELDDKINTAFRNLNIENGIIYKTIDNRVVGDFTGFE